MMIMICIKWKQQKIIKIFFYIHRRLILGIGIISSLLLVPFKETEKTSGLIEDLSKREENKKDNKEESNEIYKKGLKIILTNMRIYK